MPWPIVAFDSREAIMARFGFVPVGAAWSAPDMLARREGDLFGDELAPNYQKDWAAIRAPIWVKLPDGSEFCVDSKFYDHAKGGHYGDGWKVTGTLPKISLTPSVNCVGRYHGHITDGVITEDVEGRKFPDAIACANAKAIT